MRTKGKWVYQEESDVYTHIVRPAENLDTIIFSCGQDSTGVSEANARHICKCVNSHEALLEALRDASFAFDAAIANTPTGRYREKLTELNILRLQAIKDATQTI